MPADRRWLAWLVAALLAGAQVVLAGHAAEHAGDAEHHADCGLCLVGGDPKHARLAAPPVPLMAVANARRMLQMACPVASRGAPPAIARGPPSRHLPKPFLPLHRPA